MYKLQFFMYIKIIFIFFKIYKYNLLVKNKKNIF